MITGVCIGWHSVVGRHKRERSSTRRDEEVSSIGHTGAADHLHGPADRMCRKRGGETLDL